MRRKVDHALELFVHDPFHASLRNHPLHGKLSGSRAIFAGFDLRIIFEEEAEYTHVNLLKVGTHEQLY